MSIKPCVPVVCHGDMYLTVSHLSFANPMECIACGTLGMSLLKEIDGRNGEIVVHSATFYRFSGRWCGSTTTLYIPPLRSTKRSIKT